jgi:hypothetical protein
MDPIYYFYMLLAIQEPIRRSLQVRNCPHFFLSRPVDPIGATQAASTRAELGWKPAEPPGRLRLVGLVEKRTRENYARFRAQKACRSGPLAGLAAWRGREPLGRYNFAASAL